MSDSKERPAYWIARTRNHKSGDDNSAVIAEYMSILALLKSRHNFTTLSRFANVEEVEGHTHFDSYFLHRFPSREAALQFYRDPDYQRAIQLRSRYCETEVAILDGIDGTVCDDI